MGQKLFKIWGIRDRIYSNDQCTVDILYLQKDTFCSVHHHKYKTNQFHVVEGIVHIETDYGKVVLGRKETSPPVLPPTVHRFKAMSDSIVIETAFVNEGKIDPEGDIFRIKQGGKVFNGKDVTEEELKNRYGLGFGTVQKEIEYEAERKTKNSKKKK